MVAAKSSGAAAPLLSFYGDDFTGSTDVMEALSSQGVETVLFLEEPSKALLQRFAHCRAVGLAGTSRSRSPAWMDEHLPEAFAWLGSFGAAITHYKVCSTFDSSPQVGSIGRAIEIGRKIFGETTVPLVIGAPQIRRYTVFAHLFAAYQGEVFRIDRHPVMSRHPMTPMDESDLRLHLARQTTLTTDLVDFATLRGGDADDVVSGKLERGPGILMLDVADVESQAEAGRQLWRAARSCPIFVCGSSGVEYALVREWARLGLVAEAPVFSPVGPSERIAVVSGSVSATTERQIRHALENGFAGIALDPIEISAPDAGIAVERAIGEGLNALNAGRSVIVHTALGPASDKGDALPRDDGSRHRLSINLGNILRELVSRAGLRRAVIAGGDTSSHALSQLGVKALTLRMPLPQTPGSPLCTAHADNAAIDGMEIALKGGQIGGDDYFSAIRAGAIAE